MRDVLILALKFAFYFSLAFLAALSPFVMPGWWWALMASYFVLALTVGLFSGLGHQWAKRAACWLFWQK